MPKNNFLLDTNAVIFLTTKGSEIPLDLQSELNKADLFISIITEIELFSKPTLISEEKEKLLSFITDRLSVIDITSVIKDKTIELRRTIKLKLPDCIIVATAIILEAVLITNDTQLLNLSLPDYKVKNIHFCW